MESFHPWGSNPTFLTAQKIVASISSNQYGDRGTDTVLVSASRKLTEREKKIAQ